MSDAHLDRAGLAGLVLLVRYRAGVVGETRRTVHAVRVPAGGPVGVLAARCGAVLTPGDLEVGDEDLLSAVIGCCL
ncbi:MAG TPA: hypothetical protein VFO16_06030 [Pseudonocardiaceae bacterium]|nr:hypothetical protein [Pseudonocardiaceae bacterium]